MSDYLGQYFITGVGGVQLSSEEKKLLRDIKFAGVILFAHNYESPAQLAELVNEIQSYRDHYPFFISVDQEGGRVQRFKNTFQKIPSMREVASLNSPKRVFELHQWIGKQLSACGVNLNFSPCCDVVSNPKNQVIGDRSFGGDPKEVSKHLSAAMRGLMTAGVMSCPKHFPGHGATSSDSHFNLPVVKQDLEFWERVHLPPFYKAIKSRARMLMMSHMLVETLDDKFPCTLSPKAYEFLREHMHYRYLIITDDMEMKAVDHFYDHETAGAYALDAGADLLIYRSMDRALQAYVGLTKMVKDQKISEDRLKEKLKLINKVRDEFFENYQTVVYIPDLKSNFSDRTMNQWFESLKLDLSTLS